MNFNISIFYITLLGILKPHLAEITRKIDYLVPGIHALARFVKEQKTEEIFLFVWLYLKINICEFQLIFRGHNWVTS